MFKKAKMALKWPNFITQHMNNPRVMMRGMTRRVTHMGRGYGPRFDFFP